MGNRQRNGAFGIVAGSWVIIVSAALFITAVSLHAADEGPLSIKGTKQFGINGGYGYSFACNRDIRFADLYPYVGCVFTDPIGNGWYRGTGEWIVEGNFSYVFKKQKNYKAGINFIGRYNFLAHSENWRPYFQIGVGFIGTNATMDGLGSQFNFMPNIGSGIQYFLDSCNALNFEWRYEHISNGDMKKDNMGIDINTLLLGFSHTF
jgi:hypothetical protein